MTGEKTVNFLKNTKKLVTQQVVHIRGGTRGGTESSQKGQIL